MTTISIICFDGFTDLDVFLPWDLLNRVEAEDWSVRLVGPKPEVTSYSGLTIPMHGALDEANMADGVIMGSSRTVQAVLDDPAFLDTLNLDDEHQIIGAICSGALVLAKLGLLEGRKATTHPTRFDALRAMGVDVVERAIVKEGNVATAGGCLAAQYLSVWLADTLGKGAEIRDALDSIQPAGGALAKSDAKNDGTSDAESGMETPAAAHAVG